MKIFLLVLISFFSSLEATAFCGFYVAKADSSLYNKASQVVLVRNEGKSVVSMMSDFEGDLKEFAMVVPVPTVLQEGQINVGERNLFSRIDAFTSPRLVEYFDEDPCEMRMYEKAVFSSAGGAPQALMQRNKSRDYGVKVEAQYSIGEYDIVILSAKESDGLERWLTDNKYNIPKGASEILEPYIKQNMKFFVAKVNLKEQEKTGLKFLRPLQFAYEDNRFMLPIRLGMINAKGPQELLVYVLTKKGRVETTNYRTMKLPSNMEIPTYVKEEFKDFYTSMFDAQVKKEGMKTVFTEYFWDMGWCDPCAANPLTQDELKGLGVFWLNQNNPLGARQKMLMPQGANPVKVTRLHVRYDRQNFPEDLMFQETNDTQNFQGRYVLRHKWKGESSCEAATRYRENLPEKLEKEAQNLASLTGWDINKIRSKMSFEKPVKADKKDGSWWNNLWKK